MVVAIIIVILIVIAFTVLFVRKAQKAKYKAGFISQFYRKPPRYLNLNNFVIGRCLGKGAIVPRGDNVDIYYKKGFFAIAKDENVPKEAVVSLNPPETEHEEGLVLVLPYIQNRLSTYFPEISFYRNYIEQLERQLDELKQANMSLVDMLKEKRSPLHAREKAHRMLTSIEEILRVVKGAKEEIKESQTLTIPKTQETKQMKPLV